MSERKIRLQVTEDELKALIEHHANNVIGEFKLETSERIHDLMKRLHKTGPEIENDPRPANPAETPTGW